MANQRLKILYEKYTNGTSSDAELEELFELIKAGSDLKEVKEVLRRNWEIAEASEELTSFHWEDLQELIRQNQNRNISKQPTKKTLMMRISVAAGFLLILGMAGWFWMQREMITIYQTGYGEVKEIVLNDNSKIRLNANSKLSWDENWKRRGGRMAKVEGEAFFEVARLKDERSFHVETPDLTVKVTGTTFNVATRSQKTRVYLKSGEVYLDLNRTESTKKGKTQEDFESIRMSPGELVDYSKVTNVIYQENDLPAENFTSWKDGELIFEDVTLKTVLEELGEVYGKDFQVADEALLNQKIDVGMPYSDWETVKGLMELMISVKMSEQDGVIRIE